jgi:DNA-binding response OmpR family regulator
LAHVAIVLLVASDSGIPIYDICLAIKRKKPILPIIVIGPDDAPTKLRFFSLGADDYVLRSFDRLELVARSNRRFGDARKACRFAAATAKLTQNIVTCCYFMSQLLLLSPLIWLAQ